MKHPSPEDRWYPSRRAVLAAGVAATALSGCAVGGGSSGGTAGKAAASETNPLGVPADAPLEVVIFKGGYGDDYARHAESLYQQRFPNAKIDHKGIQRVGEVLQPRFVGDNPPDVVDNTGAGRLDLATLVNGKKLRDLADLLDAPSLSDPAVKVRDTLLPGVVEDGTFDGTTVVLNFTYTVWGVWYSRSLFAKNGWSYPKTWSDMLALCDEIRKAGIAPWTWQGKYPEYMNDPLLALAAKAGGLDAVRAVDNLEPGAWKAAPMLAAAEAIHQLAVRGHIMAGSEALSHTEAQNAWCTGKAAFIPCGSWLESEQKGVTPAGFDMVMAPTPALSTSDRLPAAAVLGSSSESFLVPARAKNPQGGAEFLRVLFSKGSARKFAELTSSLPAVKGATDGLTVSSGLSSVRDAVVAAGSNVFTYRFRTWYAPLAKAVDDATGELLARRADPAQWADRIQKAADAVARDGTVKKFRR